MSLLAGLSEQVVEQGDTDVLGGGGPIDSGIYPFVIRRAYLEKSRGGALGMTVIGEAKLPGGGTREIKQTEYITSGDAKGNKKFYIREGKSFPLPGYSWGNNMSLLAAGVPIDSIETATKTIKIWNYEAGMELDEDREVLVGLTDKTVLAAIQHRQENKTKLNDATGKYEPTFDDDGEPIVKKLNVIDKVFSNTTRRTVSETLAQGQAAFIDKWDAKYSGKIQDQVSKEKPKGAANNGSLTGSPAAAPAPEVSLFTS